MSLLEDFVNQSATPTSTPTDGFTLPDAYSADGNGLPYDKIKTDAPSKPKRNIITWFVPEFGIARMYINPQNISYAHKKAINKERTKGGYTLQYWGEELTTINLTGTTGSSGIEGINMLYEIYRAEQYAFDSVGLTLAAGNAAADLASKAVDALGGVIGGGLNALGGGSFSDPTAQAVGGGILGGLLGTDSSNATALAAKNIMSLAQLAFTVEMYYGGWVYRGFFENMTITEKASDFMLDYNITFTATQKRGYRTNYFPWSRSANKGPSEYGTPHSFNLNKVG